MDWPRFDLVVLAPIVVLYINVPSLSRVFDSDLLRSYLRWPKLCKTNTVGGAECQRSGLQKGLPRVARAQRGLHLGSVGGAGARCRRAVCRQKNCKLPMREVDRTINGYEDLRHFWSFAFGVSHVLLRGEAQ